MYEIEFDYVISLLNLRKIKIRERVIDGIRCVMMKT